MGRQSTYDAAIADDICEWLANGKSLRSYCEIQGNPTFNTVYRWLEEQEAFAAAYARARERQAHNDADKINELQDRLDAGLIAPDVARVMADCLKWTAGRRAPKSYGDKVQLSGAEDGAPIVVSWAKPLD